MTPAKTAPGGSDGGSRDALTRGDTVGRYLIVGRLGEGGMGVVYAAYDPELDRKVAIKLVRADADAGDPEGWRGRMMREAQAMARLDHPNVVSVFDVGTHEDGVFVAMELVDGQTGKQWLRENDRTWRDKLDMLLDAGRGLASAHAAGLVHRDFKPDNILIGKDGRVRVSDFGLAKTRLDKRRDSDPSIPPTPAPALDSQLTEIGAVVGTPAYMAPEQFAGVEADERTDEFSYCVTLYEALYGQRPFDRRATPGNPPPLRQPPSSSNVPSWVYRRLSKGLAFQPDERYASMAELLATLADDPAIKRRKVLVAAAAVALTAGLVVAGLAWRAKVRGEDPCEATAPLANTWDGTVRAQLQAAFVSMGAPPAAFEHTAAALDDTAHEWLQTRSAVCKDTRSTHSQSEAMLLVRLDCLDNQKEDLSALIALVEHSDRETAMSAPRAARSLPRPQACQSARSLVSVQPPDVAQRSRVAVLNRRLSTARAVALTGKNAQARQQLEALVKDARETGYLPVLAQSLLELGHEQLMATMDTSFATLDEAERTAIDCHLDSVAARAAAERFVAAGSLGKPAEVTAAVGDRARAWVDRDHDTAAEMALENALDQAAMSAGDHESALAHSQRNELLASRVYGPASESGFVARNNIGLELALLGRYSEALQVFEASIATMEQAFGPDAMGLGLLLDNEGTVLAVLGRYAESAAALQRALALPMLNPADRAALDCDLARALLGQGKIDDAIASAKRGLAELKDLGTTGGNLAFNEDVLAFALLAKQHYDEALAQSRDCLAVFRSSQSTDTVDMVPCMTTSGTALLGLGEPVDAARELERALALQTGHPAAPGALANLRFQLARALAATHGDPARIDDLATKARGELAALPFKKALLDELDRWKASPR